MKPETLKSALSQVNETVAPQQRVMVRRVTRRWDILQSNISYKVS